MIKKNVFIIFLCLLLCTGLVCACGKKEAEGSGTSDAKAVRTALAGTWEQITDDGSPSLTDLGIPSGYTFYTDGTGIDLFWNMAFHYEISGDTMKISYDESIGEDSTYQYELSGNTLRLTRTDDPDAITMIYQLQEPESETETETKKSKSKKK